MSRIFWEDHKIWKNLPLKIWRHWVTSNFKWKILSNFVAISEYPNFNKERKTSCDMTDFLLPILANCISLTTVIVMVVHITTITMGSTVFEGAFTFLWGSFYVFHIFRDVSQLGKIKTGDLKKWQLLRLAIL